MYNRYNILATYKMADSSGTKILKLEQREIYGSSRLGVITQEVRIAENASWPNVLPTHDTANAPFVLWNADSTYQDSVFINPFDSVGYKIKVNKYLGFRNYELSNHLGNVLAVISDRKYGEDADTDGELELFKPNVLSETDYYAFGSEVKERSVSGGYKFGFNGQMKDDEIYGAGNANTATFWEYDTRLGRRWNLDPVFKPWETSYHAFSNKPTINIDPNGDNDTEYVNGKGSTLEKTNDGNNSKVKVDDKDMLKFYFLIKDAKSKGKINDAETNIRIINKITPSNRSIYFSNQNFGLKYLLHSSEENSVEMSGFGESKGGLIVAPRKGKSNFFNKSIENTYNGSYAHLLDIKQCGYVNVENNGVFKVEFGVHTHPLIDEDGLKVPERFSGYPQDFGSGDLQSFTGAFSKYIGVTTFYAITRKVVLGAVIDESRNDLIQIMEKKNSDPYLNGNKKLNKF